MPRLSPAAVGTTLRNLATVLSNALASLPGDRPEVLIVELAGNFPQRRRPRRWLGLPPELKRPPETVEALADKIDRLARAPWLKAVRFQADELEIDLATAFALRMLFGRLKAAGKRLTFFTSRMSLATLYLASACDEIVMPESAELDLCGFAVEQLYMRDLLARAGIQFDKLAAGEYKSAGDALARQDMSEGHREQLNALLDSIEREYSETVGRSRGVAPETVRAWLDECVRTARRALELGIIDRIAYDFEVALPGDRPYESGARFLRRALTPLGAPRIAVISLEGIIVPGETRRLPIPLPGFGGAFAGSKTLLRALRAAELDDSTAAIVLFVDSRGGSAVASDLIGREVVRVGGRKPVVAVMGAVAGSGGYYVVAGAKHIVAAPTSMTGSIGVVAGKFVLEGLYRKYGLNNEALARGAYALAFSASRPFAEGERRKVQAVLDDVYGRFTQRVAAGRRISLERADELGRGRIYSGRDALAIGLVDELGGVATAIGRAAELAGVPADAPVWNVAAPERLLLPIPEDPTTLMRGLRPLVDETAWLFAPSVISR